MYHKALRKMKLLLVVLCLAFAYATAEDEHCGNKDACTRGYDVCVKKLGGSRFAHKICGGLYIICKKACFYRARIQVLKCRLLKQGTKEECKAQGKAYAEKYCPKPNPCVQKCKKEGKACWVKTKDKKKCKAAFIACVKKCCKPKAEEEPRVEF